MAVFAASVATLFVSGFGCELIATDDRSKIPGATTSGTGGTGGAGGMTSSTSSMGGGMTCTTPADCPDPGNECVDTTCDSSMCGTKPKDAGTATTAQTPGDCKKNQCDGAGTTVSVNDDTDLPDDGNDCTDDVCSSGVPSHPNKDAGATCGANGDHQCDGAGHCVECLVATDCPGADDECQQRACNAGVCGTTFAPLGTKLASQMPGDCQQVVCDGNGSTVTQNDDTDVPDDSNPCTNDICTSGAPSHTNAADGATCGANVTCVNGACTGCAAPSDCPGSDDECKARTCSAGVCGVNFTASGTPVAMQAPGDCHRNECDGAGNTVNAIDDADLPADDGNACTGEVCTAGVPSHPTLAVNTPCSQNGGSFCDASGQCVQCNAATQCPGSDTDCEARTCNANVCGLSFTASGTPTSSQTPGDCKENQCDGAGNVVVANKDTDVPADDGNACTDEICTAGVPSHPDSPSGTMCSQGNGTVCNGSGVCVPASCNNGVIDAPETDVDCGGGTCPACADGLICAVGTDCQSGVCTGGLCIAPTCSDGVKNGAETGVDCGGGTCPVCANGQGCAVPGDCQSGVCTGGVCVPSHSFNNPVQIDVTALLIHDTVVNNGAGALDTVQDSIDGSGYDLITTSAAKQLHTGTVAGLPDDGTFAADTNHPALHLGWNNADDGPNSRIVKTGGTFTITVPSDTYTQLQVYAVSTEGSSSMQFTLNYSDGTSDVRSITFGDWYNDPAGTGTFFVINGLDRVGTPPSSTTYDAAKDPAMAGASLNPNPAKTLLSVTVNHLTSNGWFDFFGAAAW